MSGCVVVTGGTGLVGSGIVRHFLEGGWDVVMATSSSGLQPMNPRLRIIPFDLEASQATAVRDALVACDVLVHAGAIMPHQGNLAEPEFARRVVAANGIGTYQLLGLAEEQGVPQAITIGRTAGYYDATVSEVREDATPSGGDAYALSKEVCETVAEYFSRRGSLRVATLRISAPYGPGSRIRSVIPVYVERALAGENLEVWGTGARSQTFTNVRDIARACLLAIENRASGPFNIAGSRAVTMKELAETVVRVAGVAGARVIVGNRPDPGEAVRIRISIDKARAQLGYAPAVDLEQGIRELTEFARGGGTRLWSSVGEPGAKIRTQ